MNSEGNRQPSQQHQLKMVEDAITTTPSSSTTNSSLVREERNERNVSGSSSNDNGYMTTTTTATATATATTSSGSRNNNNTNHVVAETLLALAKDTRYIQYCQSLIYDVIYPYYCNTNTNANNIQNITLCLASILYYTSSILLHHNRRTSSSSAVAASATFGMEACGLQFSNAATRTKNLFDKFYSSKLYPWFALVFSTLSIYGLKRLSLSSTNNNNPTSVLEQQQQNGSAIRTNYSTITNDHQNGRAAEQEARRRRRRAEEEGTRQQQQLRGNARQQFHRRQREAMLRRAASMQQQQHHSETNNTSSSSTTTTTTTAAVMPQQPSETPTPLVRNTLNHRLSYSSSSLPWRIRLSNFVRSFISSSNIINDNVLSILSPLSSSTTTIDNNVDGGGGGGGPHSLSSSTDATAANNTNVNNMILGSGEDHNANNTDWINWMLKLHLAIYVLSSSSSSSNHRDDNNYPTFMHRLFNLGIVHRNDNDDDSNNNTSKRGHRGHRLLAEQPTSTYRFVGLLILIQVLSKGISHITKNILKQWILKNQQRQRNNSLQQEKQQEESRSSLRRQHQEPMIVNALTKSNDSDNDNDENDNNNNTTDTSTTTTTAHCGICRNVRTYPAVLSTCGHVFCWKCLYHWVSTIRPECPLCRSSCHGPQDLIALHQYDASS